MNDSQRREIQPKTLPRSNWVTSTWRISPSRIHTSFLRWYQGPGRVLSVPILAISLGKESRLGLIEFSTSTHESGKVDSLLLGPETWMLWTVNEGSRHFDDRDSVDRFVIEAIRSYSPDSSSVRGRTCSSSRF
jgi:hypothetical protein